MSQVVSKLHAVKGWRMLSVQVDADGNPVLIEGTDPPRANVTETPVKSWGVLLEDDEPSPMAGLFAAVMGGRSGPGRATGLRPLGKNNENLDEIPGRFGLARPGETAQEAVDRIQRPALDAQARVDAQWAKDEAARTARASKGEPS